MKQNPCLKKDIVQYDFVRLSKIKSSLNTSNIYIEFKIKASDLAIITRKRMEKSYNKGLLVATGAGKRLGLTFPPHPCLDFVKVLSK